MREEPGVDRVESLLGDQAGRTLGLEASVNALHLGNREPVKEVNNGLPPMEIFQGLPCCFAENVEVFRPVPVGHFQILQNWF